VHDLSYLRFPETVSRDSLRYRTIVPRSIDRARIVCTLSETMKDEIEAEYGLDRERIHVTYPGVDDSWFEAKPLSDIDRVQVGLPERYVLAVGTLEPRKNLGHLLRAYSELWHSDPTTPPIVLVGASGWGPRLDLERLPDEAVIRTGYLATPELRSVVAGAACFAFPSMYEGFGIPPVEALACGVPVVATDLPVTREVLGQAARLVPLHDLDALAEALRLELSTDSDEAAMTRRRDQARRWTWRECARQTLAAYQDALSG
jgi:glycosyltransferase involved in cell wall biosynthesis